jgi:hypothetical protein
MGADAYRAGEAVTTVAEILARHSVAVQQLAQELRTLIKATMPGVSERAYPGWHAIGFRYAHAGYLCGIFPFEDRVQLVFERGAELQDPDGLFDISDHKQIRYVLLRSGESIPRAKLRRLLLAALHHGSLRAATRPVRKRKRV